jgi:hypothetical protein
MIIGEDASCILIIPNRPSQSGSDKYFRYVQVHRATADTPAATHTGEASVFFRMVAEFVH